MHTHSQTPVRAHTHSDMHADTHTGTHILKDVHSPTHTPKAKHSLSKLLTCTDLFTHTGTRVLMSQGVLTFPPSHTVRGTACWEWKRDLGE